MTKLITEAIGFDQAGMIIEADSNEDGQKSLYLKGVFIQGGVRNFNERVYPVHEIQKAVDKLSEEIAKGTVMGELDHPEELTINLDRVSHFITEMYMSGNNGMGKLKIIPTPKGNIIKTLIECNAKLGVSSRGVGNVDDRGEVSGFEIITVDIVAKPSAPDAFPKPVYESLNTRRGRIIEDLSYAAVHDPMARRYLQKEMLKAINELKW
jgi:Prohead core protein serine protease